MNCLNPDKHKQHMCVLNADDKVELVHSLSLKPTVECGICGAKAREPDYVCDPVQLPDIAWIGDSVPEGVSSTSYTSEADKNKKE